MGGGCKSIFDLLACG